MFPSQTSLPTYPPGKGWFSTYADQPLIHASLTFKYGTLLIWTIPAFVTFRMVREHGRLFASPPLGRFAAFVGSRLSSPSRRT